MEKWGKELPIAITVSDKEGKIIEMNDRSAKTFEANGGYELIGRALMDCHNQRAREMISSMMENPRINAYTIEKQGIKKLIYQMPWYDNGEFSGLVELSLVIPNDMPHYIRKKAIEK